MKTRLSPIPSRRLSRLTTGFSLLITLVLLVVFQLVSGRQQLIEEMQTNAAIIGANSSAALVFGDEKAAGEILGSIRLTPTLIGGVLYRADGKKLVSENDPSALFPERIADSDEQVVEALNTQTGLFRGVILAKVMQDDTRVGTLLLHVDYQSLYWRVLAFIMSVVIIGAIAWYVSYGITAGLRKRILHTEGQLEHMAFHDRVTGLPNRRFFERELRKAIGLVRRERKSAALFYIDVDNFKKINDLCGHQVGDQVLLMISERLKQRVRETDFIARVGGDEFVVILYGIGTAETAARVAEAMIAAIAQPFPTEPLPSHVGLSVGITMMPNDSDDPETLLRWSDMAMYEAKSLGKNRYQFFSDEINARVHGDIKLEAELRQALKETQGGLWMAYQPQICAKSRKIIGVEALMRWTRTSGAPVSPAEFIAVAEKSGLIAEIGLWVIDRVCRDLGEMKAWGVDIPKVAVNISPCDLMRGDEIVKDICRILDRYGEPRARFQFEVTENALMNEKGAEVLEAFCAAGFSLAIDDFGTGYSSLGYLKRFQVSTLKIDRQFVKNLPDDHDDAAIVTAVIQMSGALGISVVAEGVETEAQLEFLSGHGCDVFQGYLTGRPVSAVDLAAFVRDRAS